MNNISGFTFFKSYHESFKEINKEDRKEILCAMEDFIFDDIEPNFKGIKMSIWILIRPTLEKSKVNSINAQKSKNELETKQKRIKRESKVSTSLSLSFNKGIYFNNNKVNDLFKEFLKMRKDLKAINNERAITLLTNKLNNYDDDTKIQMLNNSIENSWKSVYEIKGKDKTNLPKWFDKEKEETDDDRRIKELAREFTNS